MTELISGTQLDHWRRCQRLYHYAHDLHLMEAETSWPLAVGKAGHAVLAAYYTGLQAGVPHAEAASDARMEAGFRMDVLGQDVKPLLYVLPLVDQYLSTYAEDATRWEVVGVEIPIRAYLGPGWVFAGTADLAVAPAGGGPVQVWDHRFLYDPYTQEMAALDAQLPRYALGLIGTLLERDAPPPTVARNMISTAPSVQLAKANRGRVKRVTFPLTRERLWIVQHEMLRTAAELVAWRRLDLATRRTLATRTVIPGERYPSCATCPFYKPCSASAWGRDREEAELLETKYVPSDYGYEE